MLEILQFIKGSSITLLALSVLMYLHSVIGCYKSNFKSAKAIKFSKIAWVGAIALLVFNLVELIVIPFIERVF